MVRAVIAFGCRVPSRTGPHFSDSSSPNDIEQRRMGDVTLWPGDIVEVVSSHGLNNDHSFAAVVKRAASETQRLTNLGTP